MKTWFLALVFMFFFNISEIQAYPEDPWKWQIVQSPTRNKISRIIAFSNGKAIAAANKLYFFESGSWKEFPVQPPLAGITRIFALDENHIWAARYKLTNESDFFLWNNETWTRVDYPLVNGIQDISLNANNEGWYCGDREIAYFQNGRADFINYPPVPYASLQCYSTGRNNLWLTMTATGMYFYNGTSWTGYFRDRKVKSFCFTGINNGMALIDDEVFQFFNGSWRMHSKSPLLKNINKIYCSKEYFWGIGEKGLVVKYDGEWKQVDIPVKYDLYDIAFFDDGTGFIVGDKGVILKYSKDVESEFSPQPGFDRLKIFNVAKDLNGEYGVVMEDFNNDGYNDIYATCIFEPNRLYINQMGKGAETFTEEAIRRNITGRIGNAKLLSFSELYLGAGSADIDNDGDQDLYLGDLVNENKLFENNGNGYFRNISSQKDRATDQADRTNSAVFSDIDNDGDLDMFLANEYSTNRLYENNGYGYFTEITEPAGLKTDFGGMGGVFADIDNDNYPDLYVVNWGRPNILYKNVTRQSGKIMFRNITQTAGVSDSLIKKSNAAVFVDYDNDGDPDLYVTNRRLTNRFYRNEGNCKFKDVTEDVIGFDSLYTYGATFADFDNDGFLDLYIANVGENKMYKNIQGKKFIDVTRAYGVELSGYSTGTACGDIDNDGDIDLYVANYLNDNSMLFINNLHNDNFICLNVFGYKSNRDAVGTKLWLYKAGHSEDKKYLLGYREISGGSGYSSKNSREVHFGVNPGKYDLVILFPASGIIKKIYNIPNGKKLAIEEIDGMQGSVAAAYRSFRVFVFNRENQTEIFKVLFVIIILFTSFFFGKKRYYWRPRFFLLLTLPVLTLYFIQIVLLRYESILYSLVVPFSSVIVILFAVHMFFEHSIMRERVVTEKQKTRDSFARDLHDDLASTISSALIYTDMLQNPELPEKAQNLITKISSLLKEAAGVVTDIIWTVSPRHDNIEDLITRLQMLMNDLCRVNSIEFHSDFIIKDGEIKIADESRRNIYLIYKEAINNIIKHASASKVNFNVEVQEDLLKFSLYDNGVGFDALNEFQDLKKIKGHGLLNIKARAGEISADLQILSEPMQGTYINLKQKIT